MSENSILENSSLALDFMNQEHLFPTGPIVKVEGKCLYLNGNDIDTDRIIPARFLKCISFEDLGKSVFADDRIDQKGMHPFDQEQNLNSSILIVNKNFGCGSSREHAPQALMRWGIRAIIGQSFAEIFYGNCLSIGIPCASISEPCINSLTKTIIDKPNLPFNLDIASQSIFNSTESWPLTIELGMKEMLLSGKWDATKTLVQEKERINQIKNSLPYINQFNSLSNK